jgi:hypothetical protein
MAAAPDLPVGVVSPPSLVAWRAPRSRRPGPRRWPAAR